MYVCICIYIEIDIHTCLCIVVKNTSFDVFRCHFIYSSLVFLIVLQPGPNTCSELSFLLPDDLPVPPLGCWWESEEPEAGTIPRKRPKGGT